MAHQHIFVHSSSSVGWFRRLTVERGGGKEDGGIPQLHTGPQWTSHREKGDAIPAPVNLNADASGAFFFELS